MQITDKKLLVVLLAGDREDAGTTAPAFGDALRPGHLDMAAGSIDRIAIGRISISGALAPFFQVAAGMVDTRNRPAGWIGCGPTSKLYARQAADLSIPQAQESEITVSTSGEQVGAASEMGDGGGIRSSADRTLEKPVAINGISDGLFR